MLLGMFFHVPYIRFVVSYRQTSSFVVQGVIIIRDVMPCVTFVITCIGWFM